MFPYNVCELLGTNYHDTYHLFITYQKIVHYKLQQVKCHLYSHISYHGYLSYSCLQCDITLCMNM